MLILIILWGAAYLLRGIGQGLPGGNLQRSVTPSHSAETQPHKPTIRPSKMTCGAFYASHRLWSTFTIVVGEIQNFVTFIAHTGSWARGAPKFSGYIFSGLLKSLMQFFGDEV